MNDAVLKLKENGELAKLKNKWWYDNTECHETTEKAKVSTVMYMSINVCTTKVLPFIVCVCVY